MTTEPETVPELADPPVDHAAACRWFEQAAEQGDAQAQFALARLHALGAGCPRDQDKALHWLQRAAEQEHAAAQYHLGSCYARGKGVPIDYRQAPDWFEKAAAADSPLALFELGNFNVGAQLGQIDYDKAAACYDNMIRTWNGLAGPTRNGTAPEQLESLAEQGEADAQYLLGLRYARGENAPADMYKALYWWEKAAIRKHPDALYELGRRYRLGEGVEQDVRKATRMLRQLAEQIRENWPD